MRQVLEQTISKSQANIETRSFQNLAGVTFGIEMRRGTTFKSLSDGAMDFLDFEVAPEIENLSTASFRLLIGPPVNWEVSMHYA